MLQCDIKKITGPAGRIEDRGVAQSIVKAAQFGDRSRLVAGIGQFDRRCLDRFPIGAQRLDDCRQNKPLDIGAWREMGAQPFAFPLVERALQ
jgi:hypothetical protein